jgi:restriction system protein
VFKEFHALTLDEWLRRVRGNPGDLPLAPVEFPSQALADEYCSTVEDRAVADVMELLTNFLPKSDTYGIDEQHMTVLKWAKENEPDLYNEMVSRQYYKRLDAILAGNADIQAIEGVTWALDLLPHSPRVMLDVLNGYFSAHASVLSDRRINGLFDAMDVVRAKFIGAPKNNAQAIATLRLLNPRHFEHLIERLYDALGYATKLTPLVKDGGWDVIAEKSAPGATERVLIECKRYNHTVSVGTIRQLLGVVSSRKANKGVVVTSCYFTKPAKEFAAANPLIELIDGEVLVELMNEHLGSTWPLRIERLVAMSQSDAS